MKTGTKCFTSFALVLIACFAQACSFDETEKANRLVEVGNASVAEGNKLLEDAAKKTDELFTSVDPEQFPEQRDSAKGLAQEAADGFEKSAAKYRDAAAKFDEASKFRIHEKLKEYLTLKAQEFNKRAEQASIAKNTPQAFLDSNDAETLREKVLNNKELVDKLEGEAGALAEKSDKIQQENKKIFKPDSK